MSAPTIIGRYHLRERLGRGTSSVVYRAVDPVLDRQTALKIMVAGLARDAAARERFLLDAQAVARLRHRHIVAVHEVDVEQDHPYLAMELLRGVTLAERIAASPPLTLVEGLEIVDQLCLGLHYAHERGVVHRSVRPANIFLLEDGSVKLLDFSLTSGAADTVTRPGTLLGSAYLAPEQVVSHEVDGRADLFAAGVVLFELVGGHRPFEAESVTGILAKILNERPPPLQNLPAAVAEPLRAILARALDKDPGRRFADALEMAGELTLVRLALLEPRAVREPAGIDTEAMPRPAGDELEYASEPLRAREALDPIAWLRTRAPGLLPSIARNRRTLAAAGIVLLLLGALAFWMPRRATPVASMPVTPPAGVKSAVATTSIEIVSEPGGAALFLNGTALGVQTPARMPADRLRNAELRAEKTGFEPAVRRLSASDLEQRRVSLQLAPLLPETLVTGHAAFPFEVVSGRTVVSPLGTSHRFTVRGEQTLRLRAPDVFFDRAVTIAPGSGSTALSVPDIGHLSVRTSPSLERCRVSVAGRDFGAPPYPPIARQPIVAGSHRVQLTCADGRILRQSVVVEPKSDRRVLFR